jgi:hypothetical protein
MAKTGNVVSFRKAGFPLNYNAPKPLDTAQFYIGKSDPNIFAPWTVLSAKAHAQEVMCRVLSKNRAEVGKINGVFIEKIPDLFPKIPEHTVDYVGKFVIVDNDIKFKLVYIVVDEQMCVFDPESIEAFVPDESRDFILEEELDKFDTYEDVPLWGKKYGVITPVSQHDETIWTSRDAIAVYGYVQVREMDK